MISANFEKLKGILNDKFMQLVMWRERHINERTFVIFLALVVGVLCGCAALLLKMLIHFFSNLVTSHIEVSEGNYLYIIYPVVGIILASLYVRYVVKHSIRVSHAKSTLKNIKS